MAGVFPVDAALGAHRHRHFGGARRRRRPSVGSVVGQGEVGLVPDGRDDRQFAFGNGADNRFLVETPEVLNRTAAARDDDQVRPGDRPAGRQHVEALDGGGNFGRAALTLNTDRPDDDMGREPIIEPMQDVANDGARRRGHDADDARQIGQFLLARFIEQALSLQLLAALLEQRHQGAKACRFDVFNDDLVFGLTGKGRQAAGRHDFEPLLGLKSPARGRSLPGHGGEDRPVVLQIEIKMA